MVLNSPRGTSDIFGEDIRVRNLIIDIAKSKFKLFNYHEIITPAFEYTEVFDRSIGQSTDIVRKEMYTFRDKKGRSLTLRPEGTASVVRAVIENKLYSELSPLKLFYIENMFRYERPQKGRMREFWQIGIEAIGSDNPIIDAEVIWLLNLIFEGIGFKNLKLLINSVGCTKCRAEYINVFKKFISTKISHLCQDCMERYEKNPLRIFDCKVRQCQDVIKNSPGIYEHICAECKNHFDDVKKYLDIIGLNYSIKKELVRGFDYYTRTIFEIISDDLENVQNALGGGGRYDNLIEQFGGPSIPSVGFAIGLDRTAILLKQLNLASANCFPEVKIYIILMEDKFGPYGVEVLKFIRSLGFICELSLDKKSITNQIKSAQKNGFTHMVIIGENEVASDSLTVKNLKTFKQFSFSWKQGKDKPEDLFKL